MSKQTSNYDEARASVEHGKVLRFLEEATGWQAKFLLQQQEVARLKANLDAVTSERDEKAAKVTELDGLVQAGETRIQGLEMDLAEVSRELEQAKEKVRGLEASVLRAGSDYNELEKEKTRLEGELQIAQEAAAEYEKLAKTRGERLDATLALLGSVQPGVRLTAALRKKLFDALTGMQEKAAAAAV